MKITKSILGIYAKHWWLISIFLFQLFLCMTGSAQNSHFLWAKSYQGQIVNDVNMDRITSVQTDSIGNVYVFGTSGLNAQLDGRNICLMEDDTTHAIANASAMFLAKFDTLGAMQWCKSARFRGQGYGGGNSFSMDMILKDNKIHILGLMNYSWNGTLMVPDWCWFFDTLYECPNCWDNYSWPISTSFPFHKQGDHTVYAVFDTDGNMLDYHIIQLFVDDENYGGRITNSTHPVWGKFVLDSDNNILLFTELQQGGPSGWLHLWDSVHPPYIIIDDDSIHRYSTGLENRFHNYGDQTSLPMLWKIDHDWQQVDCKLLIDSIAGWSRHFKVDSVYDSASRMYFRPSCDPVNLYYGGITIDEQDRIYLSGYLTASHIAFTYYNGDTLQELEFPCKFFFDSTHYIKVENLSMLRGAPFVLQCNKNGDILWCNQLYSETMEPMISLGRFSVAIPDSNKLYVESTTFMPSSVSKIFFDAEHLDTFPKVYNIPVGEVAHPTASYIVFDKITGEKTTLHIIDSLSPITTRESGTREYRMNSSLKSNCLFSSILRREEPGLDYDYVDYVGIFDKCTETTRYTQPLKIDWEYVRGTGLHVHPHGFIIRMGAGSSIYPYGTDTVLRSGRNSAFLLFYYDSTLDCRRPHATPPTPPDPPDDSTAVRTVKAPAMTFTLSPNPTSGEVTVVLPPLGEGAMLTVADATGREVRRQSTAPAAEGTRLRLDLKGLPAGAYFVTLVTPQGSHTEKLVIGDE